MTVKLNFELSKIGINQQQKQQKQQKNDAGKMFGNLLKVGLMAAAVFFTGGAALPALGAMFGGGAAAGGGLAAMFGGAGGAGGMFGSIFGGATAGGGGIFGMFSMSGAGSAMGGAGGMESLMSAMDTVNMLGSLSDTAQSFACPPDANYGGSSGAATGSADNGGYADMHASASTNTAGGSLANVNTNHPQLQALANGHMANGRTGYCVATTLDNMQRNGVAQPAATGNDVGNNPRGAAVQMLNDYGWKSLALPGARQETLRSPYGNAQANIIPAAEYQRLAAAGQIPSGAVVFQTRHSSWNSTSHGSRGFDMGIARNGGKNLHNYADMGGPMVYGGNTQSVMVLVPGGALA